MRSEGRRRRYTEGSEDGTCWRAGCIAAGLLAIIVGVDEDGKYTYTIDDGPLGQDAAGENGEKGECVLHCVRCALLVVEGVIRVRQRVIAGT